VAWIALGASIGIIHAILLWWPTAALGADSAGPGWAVRWHVVEGIRLLVLAAVLIAAMRDSASAVLAAFGGFAATRWLAVAWIASHWQACCRCIRKSHVGIVPGGSNQMGAVGT
jgi:hypothetical protein